jgi:hypothetical protein
MDNRMMIDPISARLHAAKSADGGYGSVAGAAPEPEPTAMAAIALADPDAVEWLLGAQGADGSFGIRSGSVFSDDTAVVTLALPDGDARERALDHVEAVAGRNTLSGDGPPPFGWPWTEGAYGWTEPTSWGVLALRRYRPSSPRITDGLQVLRQRECIDGGWNYGTPESFGVPEPAFIQTTAVALFATAGADDGLTVRGLDLLRRRWTSEDVGLLTLSTTAAVLRRLGDPIAERAAERLRRTLQATSVSDTVSLAWAAIALGPGVDAFKVG